MVTKETRPGNIEARELPSSLGRGVAAFIDRHTAVQRNREAEVSPLTERFLRESFLGIVKERHKRGLESNSPDLREAIDIIREMLPLPTYGVFCVDGRIKRLRVYGLVPGVVPNSGIGGFSHVPAGEIPDFRQGEGPGLVLPDDSYFGDLIETQLAKYGRIAQLRDAHKSCAAEKLKQERQGTLQPDDGLYANVTRVIKEIDATDRFVGEKDKVVSIVTSYNPYTDGLIMGLERQEALEAGKENGYTKDVLVQLAADNKIIDTNVLLQERTLEHALDNYQIDNFDFDDNYASTAVQVWRNIRKMRDDGLIASMAEVVRSVYNKDEFPGEHLDEQDIQQRAVLLVANAYTAHLHRRKYQQEQGITDPDQDPENPNARHNEKIFSINKVDDGPYPDFPDFSVFSNDLSNLSRNVGLTCDIIAGNITREDSPITDVTGTFLTPEAYSSAPKIGIAKEVVRANLDWDKVRDIDWSNMPDNWATITSDNFRKYVVNQCKGTGLHEEYDDFEKFFKGIDHLRKVMTVLNTETTTRELIEGGYMVVMPMIVNDSREVVGILPFIEKGLEEVKRVKRRGRVGN